MVKQVKTEDAIGKPLAHDVVRYGPGLKSILFKRGHVITAADVDRLKDAGNYSVYIIERKEKGVHEDDAAIRMARASAGENIFYTKPNQGKVNLLTKTPGLLKVKADVLKRVNFIDNFVISTKPNNTGVRKGELVGSVKIIPLKVDERRMREVEEILKRNKPIQVIPPRLKRIGTIVTGTEVHEGRVKDAFKPALRERLTSYGLEVQETIVVPDDEEKIKEKILAFKEKGYELILVAGGMAVDAGDVTPAAIRKTGAKIISRGVPTFPGSMFMIAYLDGTPILGLPACVIPDKRTSFDLLLPRILAKEKITREEIAELGHGGLL
jgi:molybdenum cofactor synthesis domain-containing protein